jgi:peptidyl-prolyl cis-trans isomerase SurA
MHAVRLGALIICGIFLCGRSIGAVVIDKILAVVNGEILTLQDFDDHLVLRRVYQPEGDEVDRRQDLQRLVDHILLRQEALRTRIVQIDEAEVNRHLDELGQRLEHGYTLVRVLQERGISRQKVRTWLHAQLIVRAFIDRRVRLFIRVTESQIVQYYRDHQQIVGEPPR